MGNEDAAFLQEGTSSGAKQSGSTANGGWLRFGTISEANIRVESSLLSDHLAIAWHCPVCKHTFRFTRGDIAEHRKECTGDVQSSTLDVDASKDFCESVAAP